MAITLNVGIVSIQSGSKVTTYILISAHCLKTCAHCQLNHQVCWCWHDENEAVETWAKEKPFGRIVGEAK